MMQVVVDDSEIDGMITRGRLEEAGAADIHVFDNSTQALAFILEHVAEVKLVVSDVRMPDMGGVELARALKSAGHTLPVILVSTELLSDRKELEDERFISGFFLKRDLKAGERSSNFRQKVSEILSA